MTNEHTDDRAGDEHLGAIVYGTLRFGGRNADLWKGLGTHEGAWLDGYRLLRVAHCWFPIVRPSGNLADKVRVDVITWASPEAALIGLERLDRLEGAPTLYERVRASARLLRTGAPVPGWLYVPRDRSLIRGAAPIESGNWLVYARPRTVSKVTRGRA